MIGRTSSLAARTSSAAAIGVLAAFVLLAALAGCGASAPSTPTVGQAEALDSSTQTASSAASVVPIPVGHARGAALPPFFNALSPWNTAVSSLPADPRSQEMLALAALRPVGAEAPGPQSSPGTIDAGEAGLYINTSSWAPTIVTEQGGVPTKLFCRQVTCGPDAGGVSTALIPPNVNPDPRYEGWFTV